MYDLKRVVEGEITAILTMLNGLIRAGGTACIYISLVMPDGFSIRYKRNLYYNVHKMSGLIIANLGGTAEVVDFCPSRNTGQRSFLIYSN